MKGEQFGIWDEIKMEANKTNGISICTPILAANDFNSANMQ